LKHNLLSFTAKKYSTPVVYVNQVGAIDDLSFDGSSRVYNANGELIACAKSFEEDSLEVNVFSGGRIEPLTKGLEKTLCEQKVFSLDYEPDLQRTYKTILQGIRIILEKTGLKELFWGFPAGLILLFRLFYWRMLWGLKCFRGEHAIRYFQSTKP